MEYFFKLDFLRIFFFNYYFHYEEGSLTQEDTRLLPYLFNKFACLNNFKSNIFYREIANQITAFKAYLRLESFVITKGYKKRLAVEKMFVTKDEISRLHLNIDGSFTRYYIKER